MFIIKLLSQHVSGIIIPIIRRIRPCPTTCGVLHWLCRLWLAVVLWSCAMSCVHCVKVTVRLQYDTKPAFSDGTWLWEMYFTWAVWKSKIAEAVEASKLDLIQLVFLSELVFHRGIWCEENRKLKCLHIGRNRRVSVGTERDDFKKG